IASRRQVEGANCLQKGTVRIAGVRPELDEYLWPNRFGQPERERDMPDPGRREHRAVRLPPQAGPHEIADHRLVDGTGRDERTGFGTRSRVVAGGNAQQTSRWNFHGTFVSPPKTARPADS